MDHHKRIARERAQQQTDHLAERSRSFGEVIPMRFNSGFVL